MDGPHFLDLRLFGAGRTWAAVNTSALGCQDLAFALQLEMCLMTVHLERQTECASVIVKCHSHQQSACSQDLQHKIYVTHNGTQTCSKSLLSEAIKHKHYPAPIMLKHLMQFQLPQTQGLLAPYLLPCLPFQILVCAESFVLMWTNKHLRLRVLSQGAEQCWVLLGMFP